MNKMHGSVVVTGAASGIGLAVVDLLLDSGYKVLALDIFESEEIPYTSSTHETLLKRQETHGIEQIEVYRCDVREYDELNAQVVSYVASRSQRFGDLGLSAAIACAGVVDGREYSWHLPKDVERLIVDTNLFGVMNLARATIDQIIESSDPIKRFIAVSSVAGVKALPRLGAYVASKHGVNGYVKSLALELRGTNVTVNVVSPGSTRTEILEQSARVYGLESSSRFADQHLTQRLIEPKEIADAVMFLLSEQANSITGSILAVDAGLSLT